MNSRHLLLAIAVVFVTVVGLPATAHAADYHHMHLTAPDAKVAAAWYIQHMGCEDFGREGACRVAAQPISTGSNVSRLTAASVRA